MLEHDGSEPLPSQYLTVRLAGEEYGIDILAVREIRGWTPVTRIPRSPHHLLGVVNLRGAIIPVLDLCLRFGVERSGSMTTTATVVVSVAGRHFGLVVDAVNDVLDVRASDIRPVPDMGTAVDTEYLQGLVGTGDRLVLLLDVERLLRPQDRCAFDPALPVAAETKAAA